MHLERLACHGVDDLLVLRVFVVDLLAREGELVTTLATASRRLRRWIFPRHRREREQSGGYRQRRAAIPTRLREILECLNQSPKTPSGCTL